VTTDTTSDPDNNDLLEQIVEQSKAVCEMFKVLQSQFEALMAQTLRQQRSIKRRIRRLERGF